MLLFSHQTIVPPVNTVDSPITVGCHLLEKSRTYVNVVHLGFEVSSAQEVEPIRFMANRSVDMNHKLHGF
jgi:hypothetical protein